MKQFYDSTYVENHAAERNAHAVAAAFGASNSVRTAVAGCDE